MENKTFKFVFDQKTLHFLVQQAEHYVNFHSSINQYEILEVTQALFSSLRQLEIFRRATITVSITNEVVIKIDDILFRKGRFEMTGGNFQLGSASRRAFTLTEKDRFIQYLYNSVQDLYTSDEKHTDDPCESYTFVFELDESLYTLLKQRCDKQTESHQNVLSSIEEEGKTKGYDDFTKRLDFSRNFASGGDHEYNVYKMDIQEDHQFFKNFLFIMEYCLL